MTGSGARGAHAITIPGIRPALESARVDRSGRMSFGEVVQRAGQ
jgi:hypothetical protein